MRPVMVPAVAGSTGLATAAGGALVLSRPAAAAGSSNRGEQERNIHAPPMSK